MTVYVFTIEFFNEKIELEYRIIKGVYDNREAAAEEASKYLKSQKALWPESEVIEINSNKTSLRSKSGYSKVYCIQEMPLNKTI